MTDLSLLKFPEREKTAKEWKPKEALAEFVQEVEAGKVEIESMFICYMERLPDGNLRPRRWYANIKITEVIALAQLVTKMELDDWQNP
jgi:hypothetical protein